MALHRKLTNQIRTKDDRGGLQEPVGDRPDLRPGRRGGRCPTPRDAAVRDAARHRVPGRARRADARRQRAAEPGDVRDDVDGAAGPDAHVRDVRQEHDRQGRVPAHRGPRDALRQHARPAVELPGRGGGDRHVDHGFERGRDARGHGAQVALARAHAQGRQADGPAQHGDGHQRAGLLGEVLPVLGRRDAPRADGGQPVPPERRGGGQALRREHDRRRPDPRLDLRRQLRADRGDLRARSTSCRPTPASTSRCTSTARPARSSRRSSIPTSCGTSGWPGCSRSTRPATSTGSCTRASVGWSGATRRRCPTTSCSR